MATGTTSNGPASCFPSIGKTCGMPVKHRLDMLDAMRDKKHMQQVAFLPSGHGMGHGHARALVACHRARHEV